MSHYIWMQLEMGLEPCPLCIFQRYAFVLLAIMFALGAIVSLVLAGSLPERITHLALIDGVIPPTDKGENAAERMGMALQAQLDLREKRKPVWKGH